MKKKIMFAALGSLLFSSSCFGYSECVRPVKDIWNNLGSAQSVWITFADGGSAMYKTESQLSAGQMARMTSMALTAQTTGKSLRVRYPEDGLVCPPTGAARNDVQGFWIVNQ